MMPLYSYACEVCGEKYDILCKLAQRRKTVKCTCGEQAKRVPTTASFQIDGPGTWAYTKRMMKNPHG